MYRNYFLLCDMGRKAWIVSVLVGLAAVLVLYLKKSSQKYKSVRNAVPLDVSYDYIIGADPALFQSTQLLFFNNNSSNNNVIFTNLFQVGAGPAGCALASTLSADQSSTVLLLESGGWPSRLSALPLATPAQMLLDDVDNYRTVPQQKALWGFHDNVGMVPRGKFLGGTSQMNFHIHNVTRPESNKKFTSVISRSETNVVMESFLAAKSDFPADDANFSPISSLITNGKRKNVFDIFLDGKVLNRDNLNVVINHQVLKLDVAKGRVHSLRVRSAKSGKALKVKCGAKCKVVLTAGSVATPKILVESGIGPKELLQNLNIKPVQDLPVGQNLLDHMSYPLYVSLDNSTEATDTINLAKLINPVHMVEYALHGTGIWSRSGLDAVAHFERTNTLVMLYAMASPEKSTFTSISNMKGDVFDALFPGHRNPWKEGFILLCVCLKPKSRGSITFEREESGRIVPVIDPKYLSDPEDVACMKNTVRQGIQIATSPSMAKLRAEPNISPNFPHCNHGSSLEDDAFLECAIRTAALTMYHPVGTAEKAVKGKERRVIGVDNLHVSDGSTIGDLSADFPVAAIVREALALSKILKGKDS